MKYDLEATPYYEDFKRYFKMAYDQHWNNNLGLEPYEGSCGDPLMEKVFLYDVVERKCAGFSHIINDAFYGKSKDHPYYEKIKIGDMDPKRKYCIEKWDEPRKKYELEDWLYIFMIHRITGSGINYALSPSGYYNSILFDLWQADNIDQMAEIIHAAHKPIFTSVGYQIAAFPKIPEDMKDKYGKPGKWWMCEVAPQMMRDFAKFIDGNHYTFREMMAWLKEWGEARGFKRTYWFHYAAFLADIADWFPDLIQRDSMFFYGSNATECISYLAKPTKKMSKQDFLDNVMQNIYEDLDSLPYNAEDVCCDYIRYVENYIHPGSDYSHLDRDQVWNTSSILDHPCGRQKAMIHLGYVESFNTMKFHPADLQILEKNGVTVDQYKELVKTVDFTVPINTGVLPQGKKEENLLDFFL